MGETQRILQQTVGTAQRSYPNEGYPCVGESQNVRNWVGGNITELQGNQTMKRFGKPTIKITGR